MTAEHPIIEAMARGMNQAGREWLDAQGDCWLGWTDVPSEVFARAALRALYDHGPTADMLATALPLSDLPPDAAATRISREAVDMLPPVSKQGRLSGIQLGAQLVMDFQAMLSAVISPVKEE